MSPSRMPRSVHPMKLASLLKEIESRYGAGPFDIAEDGSTSIDFDDLTVDIVPIGTASEVFLFSSLTAFPRADEAEADAVACELLRVNRTVADARSGFSIDAESDNITLSTIVRTDGMDGGDFAGALLDHVGRARDERTRIERHEAGGETTANAAAPEEPSRETSGESTSTSSGPFPDNWLSV